MAEPGGADLEAFRAEARAWLEENCSGLAARPAGRSPWNARWRRLKPTGDAGAVAQADGREGLGRADLAEGHTAAAA